MPEGYSKKSLPAKLGIKEGTRIALLNQPKNYGEALTTWSGLEFTYRLKDRK